MSCERLPGEETKIWNEIRLNGKKSEWHFDPGSILKDNMDFHERIIVIVYLCGIKSLAAS